MKRLFLLVALLLSALVVGSRPGYVAAGASSLTVTPKADLVVGGAKLPVTISVPAALPVNLVLDLASDDTDHLTTPASATLLAGQTKVVFNASTVPVDDGFPVVISASGSYIDPLTEDLVELSATGDVMVIPPAVRIIAVPSKVTGGVTGVGTVTLSGKAPVGGWEVTLASSNEDVSVPATVTVPEGRTYAKFNITSTPAVANYTTSISATDPILPITKTKSMTVIPAALSSISSSKISIGEGSDLRVVVNLTGPAAVDTVVEIYFTTNAKVEVTIPAGAKSRSGLVEAPQVTAKTRMTVYGKLGTVVKKSYVYVTNAA